MSMKKKSLLLAICAASVLTACGNNASTPAETTLMETSSTALDESSPESQESRSDLDTLGDLSAKRGLFNVELNIPKEFTGEKTQEEFDATAKELGYKSITLNSDGSATFIMTKSQHKEMMVGVKDSINSSLKDMIGSENYPNFTNIIANDDFTSFEITTKSTELNLGDALSVLGFYMYGGMYNTFNGTPVDNISVSFINADSGDVISTSNSSEMQ